MSFVRSELFVRVFVRPKMWSRSCIFCIVHSGTRTHDFLILNVRRQFFKFLSPSRLTPNRFRTAGSQRKMGSIFFPAVRRFKPGTAGWEARTLPLCYMPSPRSIKIFLLQSHNQLETIRLLLLLQQKLGAPFTCLGEG